MWSLKGESHLFFININCIDNSVLVTWETAIDQRLLMERKTLTCMNTMFTGAFISELNTLSSSFMVGTAKTIQHIKCGNALILIGWHSSFFSKSNKHYSCDDSTKAHAVVVLSTLFRTQKARCSRGPTADWSEWFLSINSAESGEIMLGQQPEQQGN